MVYLFHKYRTLGHGLASASEDLQTQFCTTSRNGVVRIRHTAHCDANSDEMHHKGVVKTYPIDWPILLACGTVAVKEVLGCQHLLPILFAFHVIVPPVVVVDFLIWEYCLQGPPHPTGAHIRSGGCYVSGFSSMSCRERTAHQWFNCSTKLRTLSHRLATASDSDVESVLHHFEKRCGKSSPHGPL